jgi:hypothetical protein
VGWHYRLASTPSLTVIVAPRFRPVSSCSWWWLGVLLWWPVAMWTLSSSSSSSSVVLCHSGSFDLHPSSTLRAVARRHGGGKAWLLAPDPPCERVLTVVGDGCWSISSLPRTLTVDTDDPPYEQVLIGRGCYSASMSPIPGTHLVWHRHCSTLLASVIQDEHRPFGMVLAIPYSGCRHHWPMLARFRASMTWQGCKSWRVG